MSIDAAFSASKGGFDHQNALRNAIYARHFAGNGGHAQVVGVSDGPGGEFVAVFGCFWGVFWAEIDVFVSKNTKNERFSTFLRVFLRHFGFIGFFLVFFFFEMTGIGFVGVSDGPGGEFVAVFGSFWGVFWAEIDVFVSKNTKKHRFSTFLRVFLRVFCFLFRFFI
jgi:hypothetical protein